jgi:uncharacterized protein
MIRKEAVIIQKHIHQKEFTIVTGARQIGKSTLLKYLFEQITDQPTVFLNLERKNILVDLNENPENVFKYCPENTDKRVIVFIDEIQYLADPTNFLKLLYDEYVDRIKIVATGSSAFYIDTNFKDSLAGRKKIFELKTLDFEGFLKFKGENGLIKDLRNIRLNSQLKTPNITRLRIYLEEYLTYGGYPAVTLDTDIESKKERLRELRDSFLKKDILESGVKNADKFYKLCMLLAGQVGSLMNVNELGNTLNLSNVTVENYLYILQKCFHITIVKPYSNNLRKELVKMPKVYFNDLGLRNAMLNSFQIVDMRLDKGFLLENLIFRRLSETNDQNKIKFWRTVDAHEVDFVLLDDNFNAKKAIEVKFSETEIKPKKYKAFTEHYTEIPLEFMTWESNSVLL